MGEKRKDGTKSEKKKRERDMKTLNIVVSEAKTLNISRLDLTKRFFQEIKMKMLSEYPLEHDIMIIRPEYQILVNPEVKAVGDKGKELTDIVKDGCQQIKRRHEYF